MPVFLGMTADLSAPQRTRVVKRAVVVAFITLIAFAFLGKFIFLFFNISTDSLRIVGGVIFFLMGYEMLQARLSRIKVTDEEALDAENDISITPLAIPMICGPGAITNAIVLMGDTKGFDQQLLLVFS
ncbi:MAG: hypothetical protein RIS47_1157, partial [Bacteroidota bacterium]